MRTLFEIKNISVTYGTKEVCNNINLQIGCGEAIGIIGKSGCGKTTLGRVILGLVKPTSGHIRWLNQVTGKLQNISDLSKDSSRMFRQTNRMIFQNVSAPLNPFMTAREIVEEPIGLYRKLIDSNRREEADKILKRYGIFDCATYKPNQMSGGQKRRLSLARAFVVRPSFVLADEPVSGLDEVTKCMILNDLRSEINRGGITFVMITHDCKSLYAFCNRIVVMEEGKIIEDVPLNGLPMEKMFKQPGSIELCAASFLSE